MSTEVFAEAAKKNLTPMDVAHRLCDEEKKSRIEGAIKRRLVAARFPEVNTVDGFEFDFDPDRKKLKARHLALHDLGFLGKGINPLFIGRPGTGKTFLARSLATVGPGDPPGALHQRAQDAHTRPAARLATSHAVSSTNPLRSVYVIGLFPA